MKYIMYFTILLNIILIPAFAMNMVLTLHNVGKPKTKANASVFAFSFMLPYLFFLILLSALGTIKYNLSYLSLLIFVTIPFILGYFVTFKTLKFYSYMQLITYFFSLGTLILLLFYT